MPNADGQVLGPFDREIRHRPSVSLVGTCLRSLLVGLQKYHKNRGDKARQKQWLRLSDIVGVQVKDRPTM